MNQGRAGRQLPAGRSAHQLAGVLQHEPNLDAFAVLCRIAATNGVRLWEFATAKGIGVQRPFDYLLPYVLHPENWKEPQISKFSADGTVWLGLAGAALRSQRLLEAYRTLPRGNSPWVSVCGSVGESGLTQGYFGRSTWVAARPSMKSAMAE